MINKVALENRRNITGGKNTMERKKNVVVCDILSLPRHFASVMYSEANGSRV